MTLPVRTYDHEKWLAQMFSAQSVGRGGVIRRSVRDVEARIGRGRLELEVRRRGFHLAECGGQFIIVCDQSPISVIC